MPLLPVPEFTSFLGLTAGRLPVAAGPTSIINSNFTAAANVLDLAASGVMSIGPTNTTQILFGSMASSVIGNVQPVFNVMAFGAKGDGVTDDTAAIQAALDTAGAAHGVCFIPPGIYRFSNLKMYGESTLRGANMFSTILQRIPGSTGTALRDKTAAEGNAQGGTGLWIRDITVDGNSTVGDGINVGNSVAGAAGALNFLSGLENVYSQKFTSGVGIIVNQISAKCSYIWAFGNSIGIRTQGVGNSYDGVWVEGNSLYGLQVQSSSDSFFHVHAETNVNPSPTNYIRIEGYDNRFFGININLSASTTNPLIDLTVLGSRTEIIGANMTTANGSTFTNLIYNEAWGVGTGNSANVGHWIDTNQSKSHWWNDSTGELTSINGSGLTTPSIDATSVGVNNSVLRIGTGASTVAMQVGGPTTTTILGEASSYMQFLTPNLYLQSQTSASGGTPLVNAPLLILRSQYWNGSVSTNIDNNITSIASSTSPSSYIQIAVQSVGYTFDSSGNFDIGTGALTIGAGNASTVGVGRTAMTSFSVLAKNVLLRGSDTANVNTPVVTDTLNTYTGNSAIVSMRNAGTQMAALDASGKFYVTAGGSGGFDTLTAGTMTLGGTALAFAFSPAAASSGSTRVWTFNGPTSTGLSAGIEAIDVYFNLNRVVTHNTGAITTQRSVVVDPVAHAFAGASTIATAATFAISGAPIQGTNATITNAYALWVQAGGVNFGQATVTQATSITTGVTCNGASGIVTTVSSTLAAATAATFTVTNNCVKAGSVINLTMSYQGTVSSTQLPQVYLGAVSAGSFTVTIYNAGSAALANTMKIHFTVT